MLRKIYYLLPPKARFWVRRLVYLPIDFADTVLGRREPMTPPRGMIFTGSGDFKKQGQQMIQIFKQYTELRSTHRVLDIGSGIGRMAVPLTKVLDSAGSYEGFDVVKKGVKWCEKNISSRYPNFNFQYIDLENDLYKSSGDSAASFTFPYNDAHFDRIIVISVFTHMLPEAVNRYFSEIERVLKPGGMCLATFFILSPESIQLMEQNNHFQFPHDHGHYRLMDERVKSANVAFEEEYLRRLAEKSKLGIMHSLPGYWCGRKKEDCKDFQDILVLVKGKK